MEIVAIWGAALSTILGLVKFYEFWRDRPRLAVSAHMERDRQTYHPILGVDVANNGRQPTTILEAGFMPAASEYTINAPDGSDLPVNMPIRIDDGEVRLVAPGGVVRYRMLFDNVPSMLHVDEPLRAYVVDSNKRTAWGIGIPMFRTMMLSGWRPPPNTDPRSLEPPEQPWEPKPLFRKWQIWKPRHLRALDPIERAVAETTTRQLRASGLESSG